MIYTVRAALVGQGISQIVLTFNCLITTHFSKHVWSECYAATLFGIQFLIECRSVDFVHYKIKSRMKSAHIDANEKQLSESLLERCTKNGFEKNFSPLFRQVSSSGNKSTE